MDFLFSNNFCIEFPTHTPLSNRYLYFLGKADAKFILGSNIIVGNIFRQVHLRQWMLSILTAHNMNDSIFIGVGAQQYHQHFNWLTKFCYKLFFKKGVLHSVRDSYTEHALKAIGITNVINTACPTMWFLTKQHCEKIPHNKANQVVFTLTDYKPDNRNDAKLIDLLLHEYHKVYFWPQGKRDYSYLTSLGYQNKVEIIQPSLEAYDKFLENECVDYVGTRLHGGIRALQYMRRSLILAVDNRAIELEKDFNLPVIHRENISNIVKWINSNMTTKVDIPIDNINKFLSQFK
ncbi:MAG: polysaccharide pyruvyl transferase family protein [Prevotellaceae bacterium]|nr:polysaccharide pyruvyl transferase family protein [Prevotellaceae bacterium]